MCATAGVEIHIETLNSCSLKAARIQRSDFDALYTCIYIYICIICIHAAMHLCIYASMHLCIYMHLYTSICIYASMHLCIRASMHLCTHATMQPPYINIGQKDTYICLYIYIDVKYF